MFRTSNPAFRNDAYAPAQTWDDLKDQGRINGVPGADGPGATSASAAAHPGVMTVQGAVNKTFFLLAICVGTSLVGWNAALHSHWGGLVTIGGGLGGLVLALVCIFKPKTSPVTAPLYAAAEGLFVGGISAVYAMGFAGRATAHPEPTTMLNTNLVLNAGLLTFGILGGMLVAYTTKLFRPGPWFGRAVVTGMVGVCVYGLIAFGATLFGASRLWSVYDPTNGGVVSIGFSVLLVALAASNLVLDFEVIENGARNGAPRYMEWYSAFGLMLTLVWLYLEVLRLLSKLRSRD